MENTCNLFGVVDDMVFWKKMRKKNIGQHKDSQGQNFQNQTHEQLRSQNNSFIKLYKLNMVSNYNFENLLFRVSGFWGFGVNDEDEDPSNKQK